MHLNVGSRGGRWRCLVCESFISWQDLEYCGYTKEMLEEFSKKASTHHDRIEVTSSGTYRLLDERKVNQNGAKRKHQTQDNKNAPNKRPKKDESSKKGKADDHEIIEIL